MINLSNFIIQSNLMIDHKKISIIGGAGHIGLPLSVLLFNLGYKVNLVDTNNHNLDLIKKGKAPFYEKDIEKYLKKTIGSKRFLTTNLLGSIKDSKFIFICIGTPISNKLKPDLKNFFNLLSLIKKIVNKKSHIIIRSSIAPGTFSKIFKIFNSKFFFKNISYCPERVLQGKSMVELSKIPQIISSYNYNSLRTVKKLFNRLCKDIVVCKPEEAEMAKILSNAYRYLNFSIANQFFQICDQNHLNFEKIRRLMRFNYSRTNGLAAPGLVGGPCLMKDTMQLNYLTKDKNNLLKNAYLVNEGLPKYIVNKINKIKSLRSKKVLVLGKTFKANNDDLRGSLAIKLIELLKKNKIKHFVYEPNLQKIEKSKLNKLIKSCNIFVLATAHDEFKKIKIPPTKHLVDVSGFYLKT